MNDSGRKRFRNGWRMEYSLPASVGATILLLMSIWANHNIEAVGSLVTIGANNAESDTLLSNVNANRSNNDFNSIQTRPDQRLHSSTSQPSVDDSLLNQIEPETGNEFINDIINNNDNNNTANNQTETNGNGKRNTPILKLIHDYLLVILIVSVMFSMGCGVTLAEVLEHLKKPTSVLVCIVAQFFLVPFIGYLLISLLDLDSLHATGLLILACCPGGVTSNIFTYLADGDLSLSITMTSVATIAALLLMPMNVWLYGRNLEADNLVIPYLEMCGTLILVTIPVVIGMGVNWLFPKIAPIITKIGIFSGFGIIVFCQTLEVVIFPDIFNEVPYRMYTAVIMLPAFSFVSGYLFAKLFRLNDRIARTIGIEIGIKNVGSALTIISLSFALMQLKKAWLFPFLYAFSSFIVILLFTLGFRVSQKYAKDQMYLAFKLVKTDINDNNNNNTNNNNNDDNDNGKSNKNKKDNYLAKELKIYQNEGTYNPIMEKRLLDNTCEIIMPAKQ